MGTENGEIRNHGEDGDTVGDNGYNGEEGRKHAARPADRLFTTWRASVHHTPQLYSAY